MPWVQRGLRHGILTTSWPKRIDSYFTGFLGRIEVLPGATHLETTCRAAEACPTGAISASSDGVFLDQGRCILCGRCVAMAPAVFARQPGSDTAVLDRQTLVVGTTEETDEALDELRHALRRRVRRLRRSVHIRHVDAGSDGSDEWEVHALTNPVYDVHRLGIFFTASPRHADILLVTGIGTDGMVQPLRRTLEAMPRPTVVIAAGTDAISGGLIGGGYTGGTGIGDITDVDVWVPGAPATPFSLMHAILLALGRLPDIDGERS
ncbi:NADH ubiquinone oxidoreductase, 20 kDa subunit [uncultured Mycobacterium sp.]|uniref:NADH ubiquinone oxidoreductase, 20 kDa subunit n=1 Tax=uncultured Mycobacterium sp. TaxID=171292 RepID=A0A1Y5PHF1_9MYCO|nr:NADH ubiquinone oxidoreductase, 20 kDa subunit [uncultured Mycobacterium sp.]